MLQRAARVVLHNKRADLVKSTDKTTRLLPFTAMTMLRCVLYVRVLLSREITLPFLPLLLTAEKRSQKLTPGIVTRCNTSS